MTILAPGVTPGPVRQLRRARVRALTITLLVLAVLAVAIGAFYISQTTGTVPSLYPGVGSPRVTAHGTFFTRANTAQDIRRGEGLVAAASSLTDGRFLDRFQQWDEGAVWWEEGLGPSGSAPWIEIDLGGSYTLESAIVQADNNDAYRLSYRSPSTGAWEDLWIVPPEYAFGMITRPDQYDDTARHRFPSPVTTDALRFEALEGDGMYAVSEIQVFGSPAGR